jgi:CheY-like chemotaxis protein
MLKNKRILVVDDDEISRLVAAEVLGHLGATVDLAVAPDESMRLVGSRRYDLVMLDLHMPGMNGIELARIMTSLDASLAGRIALLTGGGPEGSAADEVAASRLHVFSKPLQPDRILDFISRDAAKEEQPRCAAPPAAGEVGDYPDIDGIDIAAGVRNFLGQEQAYFATLRAFPEYSRKLLADLSLNASRRNTRECMRLAHSLKGSSAMIGALDIHAVAREMESSFGPNGDQGHLEALCLRLEALILHTNRSIDACIRRRHHLFRNS